MFLLSVDLLDHATFFRLCVDNNLPLAFIAFSVFSAFTVFIVFVAFVVFAAFDMLPSVVVHDAACYDILMFLSMNNLITS